MPPEPKCMKCDNPATHKITKIVKGKVYDLFLCDEHAAVFSPYVKPGAPAHLVEILHQILKQQEQRTTDKGPVCTTCGLSYHAYRKTLLLGCSDCYEAFSNFLLNDIRKIHGVVSHYPDEESAEFQPEKFPEAAGEEAAKPAPEEAEEKDDLGLEHLELILSVEDLQEKMNEAVRQEDFEKAAKLRDSIRLFKQVEPLKAVFCEKCQAPMRVMHGIKGFFLACSKFPECRNTHPVEKPPQEAKEKMPQPKDKSKDK